MHKIFIDGSAGTTGLRIRERLSQRKDLELMILPDELRKDTAARSEMLNKSDISFLCLPDQAAIEAVSLIENPDTVVIDTSTAHRTADGWTYGMPELTGLREQLKTATRIAKGDIREAKVAVASRYDVINQIGFGRSKPLP